MHAGKSVRVVPAAFCILCTVFTLNVFLNTDTVVTHHAHELALSEKFNQNASAKLFEIHNDSLCKSRASVPILILIHSAITNFENRAILRDYIPASYVKVFLLGQPVDRGLRQLMEQESQTYNDLVIGNFHDTYRNLTLKHLMALQWAASQCSQAQFVVKLDDDIIVNFKQLETYLEETFPPSTDVLVTRTGHRLMAGYVQSKMQVVRNVSSKWFVSEREFNAHIYPDFLSGWAYVTTIDTIAGLLLQAAAKGQDDGVKPLWVDDVYVTGVLREASRDIALHAMNKKFNVDIGLLLEWLSSAQLNEHWQWPFLFSNANGDRELMRQALEAISECEAMGSRRCKCCFPTAGHSQGHDSRQQRTGSASVVRIAL